ncbi:GRIP and coiled-coil domain-containing protein 2 [Nephila pilipes]|uniref:GRIP and coiled-coil domain-containing protein 2 n=1 Tax=Nephila pilipes TaxID=299642 RepID=A0A8X6TTH8_NEPPI|nr:GRIP and coiled-coil domain-containing protein 2 [Nephila pilipes]
MAELASDAAQESEETKKKIILEEKSKEDLIKIVRKQLTLLQKAKGKSEELNKKCQTLEEEKKLALEKQEYSIIDLQQQLENLEKVVSDVNTAKNKILEEKDHEIMKLKEKVKCLETEKDTYFSSVNEKEEKIHCLSLQLNTVKETCHCLQDELQKFQKINKDLKDETNVLLAARDAALESLKAKNSSLDFKIKECNDLIEEISSLEKKYTLCIEENCCLASKMEILEKEKEDLLVENSHLCKTVKNTESANCQDNDIFFLINDNQRLQAEINTLKEENENLKELSSDQKRTVNDSLCENTANTKSELQSQEILEMRKENLGTVEGMGSKLKISRDSLEEEICNLSKKIEMLECDKLKQNIELEAVFKERTELKEEVDKLMSSLQEFTEFKIDYEHALLQGAATEGLMLVSTANDKQKFEVKNTNTDLKESCLNDQKSKQCERKEMHCVIDTFESGNGFEFGLLGGGDVDELYDNIDVKSSCKNMPVHCEDHVSNDNLMIYKNSEIEETHNSLKLFQREDSNNDELRMLKMRVDEYANLLQETIFEKESLKLELENFQKEKSEKFNLAAHFVEIGTNTEFDVIDKKIHEEKLAISEDSVNNLENHISILNQKIELLEIEKSNYVDKHTALMKELEILNSSVKSLNETIDNIKTQNENIKIHSNVLEKQNHELSEKVKGKVEELVEFNYQLEQIIICVEKGLNQKSVAVSNRTKNQLKENVDLLRILLDDLLICNDNNLLKTKTLEDNLNDLLIEKQAADEDLFQIKELNQFLEDEIRELRSEVEQFKINKNCYDGQCSDPYYEDQHLKSPNELYSIEEIDEKFVQNDTLPEFSPSQIPLLCTDGYDTNLTENSHGKIHAENIKDVPNKADASIQVEIKEIEEVGCLLTLRNNEDYDAKKDEDIRNTDEYKSIIEQLNDEKATLKCSLDDKSILVEKIHCEMDSLLEKIETLNVELHEKDDDLKHSQYLITQLENKIHDMNSISNSKQNSFNSIKNTLNKLHNEGNDLKSDVSSLYTFSSDALSAIKNSLVSMVEEYMKKEKIFQDQNSHFNKVIHYAKLQIDEIAKDLCMFSDILKGLKDSTGDIQLSSLLKDDINYLQHLLHDKDSNIQIDFSDDYCNNDCCVLISDIKQINVKKQKLFCDIYNDICTSYLTMSKELNEYKKCIIPNFEATIRNLEDKLNDGCSKKSTKEAILIEQKPEKSNAEESSITDLKKQLADTELKMNKCKQIALKLKKELMESKKQIDEIRLEKDKYVSQWTEARNELDKISSEQFQYVQNYQSLQNENDKIQDELEIQKEKAKMLETDLSTTITELNSLKGKLADVDSQLLKSNQFLEANALDKQENEKLLAGLESKLIVLESKKQEKVHKIEELETELKEKMEKINSLIEENNTLKEQLESSQKVENKKNLLDLEMADYERSILELNNKIQKKDEDINELKLKLSCEVEKSQGLLEEIKSTEKLKETEGKRADNLKEILDKTKSELAYMKERETELLTKVSHLQMQLEFIIQQEENCKLQLSEASSETQHLKEMIKTSSENHQRIVHTLETKVSSQKQEILCAHKEVENIKQDFENYKIRVHSVLKQQKSSTPFISVDEDVKEKLETMVDKLKLQVKNLSEKLSVMSMEYESLQEEYDSLLQRHNKVIEDREKKDGEWHAKLEQINVEKSKLRAAQEELSSQHLLQNEMLVSTYKKQIKIMSDEHKRTVSDLQKQLESADLEIARLQRDQQKAYGLPLTPTMQDNPHSFDIFSQERQEGEGSESIDGSDTPIRHLSLTTIPTSGFLPFEKLLQSPHDELNISTNYVSYQDCDKIIADLNASNKKIEHLTEVLNESESTNLRLSEQVRVLKEEVRRLERNKEREQHAENLEYLKNVFIKFATLGACSEKAMLIPVLTTMLKLSPAEQQQLKNIAGDFDTSDSSGSGWGSYLHRWSGLA